MATFDDPVSHYTFDSADISGTTAIDRGSSGHNATLVNGPTLVQGQIDKALSFDGSTQFVQIPVNQPFANDTFATTFACWFNASSSGCLISGDSGLPSGGALGSNYDPLLYVELTSGKLHGGAWVGSLPSIESSTSVIDGKWHHAAVTYDGSTQVLYLDGVSVASQTAARIGIGTTTNWLIGVGYTNFWGTTTNQSWFYFGGSIDDVRIYNRSLSSVEVAALAAYQPYRWASSNVCLF